MASHPHERSSTSIQGFRGSILDFVDDPFYSPADEAVRYFPDGLMLVRDGHIDAVGAYENLQGRVDDGAIKAYPGKLIMPGFIDTHIHYPQTEMIAAYGEQLLEWLKTYTFPTEGKFQDKSYAEKVSGLFLDELLRNGTIG